jgi:hypothetical protein
MLVSCKCYVQQERIRLLELLVSSQCPQQAAALASPHLEAVIAYLRACFQVPYCQGCHCGRMITSPHRTQHVRWRLAVSWADRC